MTIGQRIKERRKALGISADALGKKLGKDRSTVFRYENGDIEKLPIDILRPIAEALLTTPEYLMGWSENEKEQPTDTDRLSEKRKKLMDFVMSVPDDKAEMLLRVMKSIVEGD